MSKSIGIITGLFLGRQSSQSLWTVVQSAQQDDPLAPVTVVGPSNYANLSLRHRFARSGFANVRFLVLPRLAEYLGAHSLAAQGRTPLSSVLESTGIRAASSQATGQLSAVRSHPSTQQSLRNTFRQLRYASAEALARLTAMGGLSAEVVDLYRRYVRLTANFYDDEQLALSAAESVRTAKGTALDDLGFIVFFRVRDLSPGQRDLVRALASQGGCTVMLDLTGDRDADAPVQLLASSLSAGLGEPRQVPAVSPPVDTHLLIAPDPHQEIRWVIRRVMTHAERGTPFHRIAVLYRQLAPYGTLIRQELELAGVPLAGPDQTTLASTAVGRALIGLMEIAEGGFARGTVTTWFTGSPIRSPIRDGSGSVFSPSLWDSITKKAGITGGLDQWSDRLQLYADGLDRRANDGEAQEEISEARAAAMRAEATAARELLDFVSTLAQHASPPDDGSPWSAFVEWAGGLIDRYVVPASQMPESELNTFEKIKAGVAGLETAMSIEPRPSFGSFLRALDEVLNASVGHLGVTGQGVFVASIGAAAGMEFDVIHIVGMTEGAVPPAVRDDPLIADRQRQAAGGVSEGIPLQSDRRARERYEFLSALAAAPVRVLSYPVGDSATQRAHSPSRWFLEQAAVLNGSPVYASTLPSHSASNWLTVIPSVEAALDTVADATWADLADYELERLWRWKKSRNRVDTHPLAKVGDLARSFRLRTGRYSARFTEWDGNVAAAAQGSRYASRLARAVHSPTSLERWARCPFSYFLGGILRVGSTEKPEDNHSITPLERGSLIHEILERFIRDVSEDGTMPLPRESWNSRHRSALRRIAEEALMDAEARGVTGKPLMWDLESEDILNDLDTFLERDTDMRHRFGVSPLGAETAFGMGSDSWPDALCILQDGTRIRFRGVIDRVDIAPNRDRAIVIDYKTGSARPYAGLEDDPTDMGRRLQLSVYALAAQQALGEDVDVRAAYWFVTGRAGFAIAPKEPVEGSSAPVKARLSQVVTSVVSGIRNGVFPANPGKETWRGYENCSFCDFNSLCPSRRGASWARMRNSSTLKDYRDLVRDD